MELISTDSLFNTVGKSLRLICIRGETTVTISLSETGIGLKGVLRDSNRVLEGRVGVSAASQLISRSVGRRGGVEGGGCSKMIDSPPSLSPSNLNRGKFFPDPGKICIGPFFIHLGLEANLINR